MGNPRRSVLGKALKWLLYKEVLLAFNPVERNSSRKAALKNPKNRKELRVSWKES